MNFLKESLASSGRMVADTARVSLAASVGCFVLTGFAYALNQFVPDAIHAEGLGGSLSCHRCD